MGCWPRSTVLTYLVRIRARTPTGSAANAQAVTCAHAVSTPSRRAVARQPLPVPVRTVHQPEPARWGDGCDHPPRDRIQHLREALARIRSPTPPAYSDTTTQP
ncbi:hypothetical protein [Streptomyces sp. NPDC002785]|uniref:hypothetical protein n=1 Tax=Streptomyces sp. NPDC002785 TaxID=3154543 RepID=UPI00331DCE3A